MDGESCDDVMEAQHEKKTFSVGSIEVSGSSLTCREVLL